ncbi:NAD-dependent deacetylase sir2D [Hondaea fermentalgiana]|uniref:NAD-dependent deacetylase sir2D n=1 Tax=Hondaea fermentalgiana TaxID=2315210 RepID=A0A2R5GQL0_9STRA|nr:NAD-dependent deacetylase sir2D [Hondaea fermentalgiana]|eukprot:GBG32048.1 NAD-dependent deacetylase sir2D [Hondaea fermentalgiana]
MAAATERAAAALQTSQRVAVLLGAGISVGSGIPDFRSPGGMYDTLRPDLLTATPAQRALMARDPTAVVSWTIFRENQLPYLELRRPFILGINEGRWKPSLAHYFLQELQDRGKLHRCYSQNIDGLELMTGLDRSRVVTCHGSLGAISCEFCGKPADRDWFTSALRSSIRDIYGTDDSAPKTSTPISCPACGRPGLKPSTVLYGRSLPGDFFEAMEADFPSTIDLVIVVGTSLTVSPANQIPCLAARDTPRIVVNMEPVGEDLGLDFASKRDIFLGGACDDSFANLLRELGWSSTFASKPAGERRQQHQQHQQHQQNAEQEVAIEALLVKIKDQARSKELGLGARRVLLSDMLDSLRHLEHEIDADQWLYEEQPLLN